MSQFRRYKPFPALADLDPGIEPGWDFDVLVLQAEPEDKVGSIILADTTKDDEKYAATEWLVVGMSPTAFRSVDWDNAVREKVTDKERPFDPGDVVLTKRYPPGADITGHDGRTYRLIKDKEILAKRIPGKSVSVSVKAAA